MHLEHPVECLGGGAAALAALVGRPQGRHVGRDLRRRSSTRGRRTVGERAIPHRCIRLACCRLAALSGPYRGPSFAGGAAVQLKVRGGGRVANGRQIGRAMVGRQGEPACGAGPLTP